MYANPVPLSSSLLVRGVNWLGDAVMTTPALQRLREKFPQARITILTHEKLEELWRNHPSINEIATFSTGEGPWTISQRLRQLHFDLALILPNSPRSALEPWLARIPVRLGYARPWRNWLLTQALTPPPTESPMRKRSRLEIQRLIQAKSPPANTISSSAHQIHSYLHLAAALGANPSPVRPFLHVTESETQTALQRLAAEMEGRQSPDPPLFGLNPGAEYGPAKRWPTQQFIQAATELGCQTKCQWLVFGGKNDVELAAAITEGIARFQQQTTLIPPVNLAGKTSLRELCALLKLCRVLLTNDTGPMHLAAAVGTPVVVPVGSTSAALTGPGLPGDPLHQILNARAPCSPCFLRECPIDFRCMTGISVESVVQAVLKAAKEKK